MAAATEKAWAVALARDISSNLHDAVRAVPGLALSEAQIAALQAAFQRRLIQTMGEDADDKPTAPPRGAKK